MRNKQQKPNLQSQQKLASGLNSKKYLPFRKYGQNSKHQYNNDSSSRQPSTFKFFSLKQPDTYDLRTYDIDNLGMDYFEEKYMLRDSDNHQGIQQEIKMVLKGKKRQIEALRIYRDQLMLMSRNTAQAPPIKISVQTLKKKAEIQSKLEQKRVQLQKQLKTIQKDNQQLQQYKKYMQTILQNQFPTPQNLNIDITKQQQVMLKNLELQTTLLIKQLSQQQKKNTKQIKSIQDQILQYRFLIKQKQDYLRNIKAKICTLYIKLNSRNKSNSLSITTRSKSLSLSIRKFNNNNHTEIKQAFIGNTIFKNYSREIIQKINSEQQLVKIKFFYTNAIGSGGQNNSNAKQLFYFQCFYKGKEGIVHNQFGNYNGNAADKNNATVLKVQEITVKYLFSMKFYYKSRIVGVQCRVKSEKGNKHIQIGTCAPTIEHELLTLVNKKIITLGSFWRQRQMIGVSIWYNEKQKKKYAEIQYHKNYQINQKQKQKQKSCYHQYYS